MSTATVPAAAETASSIDERLIGALRARGQRVTPQRLVIARAIGESNRHLTAEVIFEEVSERLPGLSLPTVYATLELLEELSVVRRVATESGTVVYDSRAETHDHLVCRRCGRIADVETPLDRSSVLQRAAQAEGFVPDEAQVIVRGLCADCAAA